jgi:predicted transcriptional regulator YdeE
MMEIETIESKTIKGLRIKTSNEKETNAETGQIPGLWQLFDNNVGFDFDGGSRVYGVYYDYEPDATGEFTVLVGTDQLDIESILNLETIDIKGGKYAVFYAKGEMPKTVIDTWGEVWKYFSQDDAKHKRTYKTDFEFYVDSNELKIYIAIE